MAPDRFDRLDACSVRLASAGVRLQGWSVFCQNSRLHRLRYSVPADNAFCTRQAFVAGLAEPLPVRADLRLVEAGHWTLNGIERPVVCGCPELDLAFTPATNLLPLQRLQLLRGEAAEAPAAYLDLEAARLTVLEQRYERLSRATYQCDAPAFGYRKRLLVLLPAVVMHYLRGPRRKPRSLRHIPHRARRRPLAWAADSAQDAVPGIRVSAACGAIHAFR